MRNARRLRVAVLAVAAVAVLAVGVAVAAGGDDSASPPDTTIASTTTTAPAPTTTTTLAPVLAPLTGVPVGGAEVNTRPAVVVKVDDTSKAHGRQAGLAAADVVYVEQVEGGATRLAAVFHSTGTDAVGPVRSARTSDLDLVSNLNRPLFAFSGANGGVLREVRGAPLVDLGYDARSDLYEARGTGVLRFHVSTADLWAEAPADAGPPPPIFAHRPAGTPVTGEVVAAVDLAYGRSSAPVRWVPAGGGWARSIGGAPHVGADGQQLTAENVVVQMTTYRASGYRDVNGAPSPEAVLVGDGEAWILTGDRLVRGRWARPDPASPTVYTDAAGQPLGLAPGRTWVELVPAGGATVVAP